MAQAVLRPRLYIIGAQQVTCLLVL